MRVCYETGVSRLAFQLTCLALAFALCAAPGVDAHEGAAARATLRKPRPERGHLGLPAPHGEVRAPVPFVFIAPGSTSVPLPMRAQTALQSPREDLAPESSWRARAHPAQAPPAQR